MTAEYPLATAPIASSEPGQVIVSDDYFFNPSVTLLSQYANSPILLQLIDDFAQWLDPARPFNEFFALMWDIDSAQGYGLDVWGRILGVGRVLAVPSGQFLGFQQDADAQPFGFGILYHAAQLTNNVALTDEAYRALLLAKAALNITDSSIPSINNIMLSLFGQGYVRDNGDMTLTYVFTESLTPVQTAIVYQSNVLPKPTGVSFTVEVP